MTTITNDILYIYRHDPNDLFSNHVDMERCRYKLFEWHAHQCSRKPTRTIQGHGFCTQHAKMVEKRLVKEEER